MTHNASRFPSFGDVDYSSTPGRFIDYMDVSHASESVRERAYLRDPIGPRQGQRILDVGCGTGIELVALAEAVGPNGEVVGIDKSMKMLSTAFRCSLPNIRLIAADVRALPFSSRYFDACRTERVLQHVKQPGTAISEMVRVTTAGGRIIAIEPDWGTLMIDSSNPELTHKIVEYKATHRIANGWIGRQLRRFFMQ